MTDEEMAKEYSKSACAWIEDREPLDERDIEQAFLAGLKAGRPQWHDLRKDKNDLPKGYAENTRFLCSVKGETLFLIRYGSFWQGNFEVDAWCEIPKFEEAA